jgi:hypothetical protein
VNNFWDWFWLMVWWFLFLAFLMVLFRIFADVFRDRDLGGWGKALWCVFLIFIPVFGSLVYLIARGKGMTERSVREVQDHQSAQAEHIRSVAASSTAGPSPAEQVAKAKGLLDAGTISTEEFSRMKAKALA